MLLLVVNNYKVKCMLCALDSLSNSRVSSLEMKKKTTKVAFLLLSLNKQFLFVNSLFLNYIIMFTE